MVILAFILLAVGGLLFAEAFSLSQRGLHGLQIRYPLLYNLRGLLQLLSFGILIFAVVILFLERWWLGLVGLVLAWPGTAIHVFVFLRLDSELREKVLGSKSPKADI